MVSTEKMKVFAGIYATGYVLKIFNIYGKSRTVCVLDSHEMNEMDQLRFRVPFTPLLSGMYNSS